MMVYTVRESDNEHWWGTLLEYTDCENLWCTLMEYTDGV